MDEDRDRNNEESNFYPSDYIDFTPTSNKSSHFNNRLKAFVLIATLFLLALFFRISIYPQFASQKSTLPVVIEKVKKNSQDIINELKKLSQTNKFQIDELTKLIDIDLDLEDTVTNLRNIKRDIDIGKYPKIEEKEFIEIIKIDLDLGKSTTKLREIKEKLKYTY